MYVCVCCLLSVIGITIILLLRRPHSATSAYHNKIVLPHKQVSVAWATAVAPAQSEAGPNDHNSHIQVNSQSFIG